MSMIFLYLLIILIVIIFFSPILYPIYLKRKIVNNATQINILDNSYYFFKISTMSYIFMLFSGILYGLIFLINPYWYFLQSTDYSIGMSILMGILALIGVCFSGFCLLKILYLYPKTFIEYDNGKLKYYDGINEVSFERKDILNIEFREYSIFWYITVKMKGSKEELPIYLLAFKHPTQIYSLLSKKL